MKTLVAVIISTTLLAAQDREVLVSAAASLTDVLQELATAYQSRYGERLVLNLAASNTLARQIGAGSRVDVFISADEVQMDAIRDDIVPDTRVALLSNQLAIAVADDRPRRMTSARDLTDPTIRRVAIGDPDAVPAGVYARTYLQRIGVWSLIVSKIVPSGSVRLALAAVETGAADAAIVYRTDIPTARRAREALVIPVEEGPRIVYPAAVVRAAPNPEGARRFIQFLRSAEASLVFTRAGFQPLTR